MDPGTSRENTLEFVAPASSLSKKQRPSTSSGEANDVLRKKFTPATKEKQTRPQTVNSLPEVLAQHGGTRGRIVSPEPTGAPAAGTTHRRALELASRAASSKGDRPANRQSSRQRPRTVGENNAAATLISNKDPGGRDPNEPTELEGRMALRQEAREAVKRARQTVLNWDVKKSKTKDGDEEKEEDDPIPDENETRRSITNLIIDHDNQAHAIIRMLDAFDHWHGRVLDETNV
jgi:hypothetical protein